MKHFFLQLLKQAKAIYLVRIICFVFCFFSFFLNFLFSVVTSQNGSLFAQGEANIWYFGNNAGLNFNGGTPVALTNGQVFTTEGSASISNAAGNLLFYTDGSTIWNSNHLTMANGTGLMGNGSSAQSGVIIQKPGSSTIYYVFTADAFAGPNGIRYNEVDMTLNAGLGGVTALKNILLNTPSCEKIVGIRHCNNKDVWVVTHDWNSNGFRTYLVTAAGVNPTPVISNAGLLIGGNTGNSIGNLKGSPDGKKLASASNGDINRFELFDFNNSTGVVSNAILFPQFGGPFGYAYGVEFSPDGTKLYGSHEFVKDIYQFDLCAGSNSAIASSGITIGTTVAIEFGTLQLGPDGKIYVATFIDSSLGVINNPNILGVGCGYVDKGVSLSGKFSTLGLPNFVNSYFKDPPPPFTTSVTCLDVAFTAPVVNFTNCNGSGSAINSVLWNFGDPAAGGNNTSSSNTPSHAFTGAGTYTVTLVLNYACGSDTIKQNITVVSCGFTTTASSVPIGCNGQCTGTATANTSAGTSPFTYSWNSIPAQNTQSATGLCQGSYTVTVTDALGGSATASVTITAPTALSVSASTVGAACGANNGSATVIVSGGTSAYTYSWNMPGQTTSTATGLIAGGYTATITDANGCAITKTVTVISTAGSVFTNQSASICSGSTYTLPGGTIVSTAGTYEDTLTSSVGCDSIITTTLTVSSVLTSSQAPVICSGSTYTLPGGTIVSTAGTYEDTLTSSGGCDSIITTTLTVSSVLTLSQSPVICSGSTYTLPGGTIVNTAGTYEDTLTSSGGCDSIITTNLTVSPVTTSSQSPSICSGSTFTLPGGTIVNIGGTYKDTLTSTNGCDSIITTNLTVNPSPIAAAFSDVSIFQGESVTLTASGVGTYSWSDGTNVSSTIVTPLETTLYCVTVTSSNSCTDMACVTVAVNIEPLDCSNPGNIYLPNAFSPNGDGENDLLELYYGDKRCIESIKLVIYNRWGEKVFESADPEFSWDGEHRGQPLDTQVLVYYLRADFRDQSKADKKGNISLVR